EASRGCGDYRERRLPTASGTLRIYAHREGEGAGRRFAGVRAMGQAIHTGHEDLDGACAGFSTRRDSAPFQSYRRGYAWPPVWRALVKCLRPRWTEPMASQTMSCCCGKLRIRLLYYCIF